jgi:predicted ester cyclase
MTLSANKKLMIEFFDALNEGRLDDLPKYLAPDIVDHNKVIAGEEDRPGAAFGAFAQQLAAFTDLRLDVQEMLAEDDRVAVRLVVSGVHTGHHPRMAQPTGRSFQIEQIWILTVRNGYVSELRAVSDRLGLFMQLGWPWPEAGE